jgi:hypothetical protein
MITTIPRNGELADLGDFGALLKRLLSVGGRIRDWIERALDGWYPGKLTIIIAREGLIPAAKRLMTFAFRVANDGPEWLGTYLDSLFYTAPDASRATKFIAIMRGSWEILRDVITSTPAQKIIKGALLNAGIPPAAVTTAMTAIKKGFDEWPHRSPDYQMNEAMKWGQKAIDELGTERLARFAEEMEQADIQTDKVEITPQGKGLLISIEQIDPVSGLIEPAQIIPIEGLSIVRSTTPVQQAVIGGIAAEPWPLDVPSPPMVRGDMPPPVGDPVKPDPPVPPIPPPPARPLDGLDRDVSILPLIAGAALLLLLIRR